MRQPQFKFEVAKIWQEKLPRTQCNYLTDLHNESFEAMKTILDMLETDWDSNITRFPICIETPPTAKEMLRKYCMASEAEFLHIKRENPDLVVRRLNEEEMLHLTQQEEELQ